MKAAYDRGINFFDCAEAYAGGESEIVMGQAIKKFGYVFTIFWKGSIPSTGIYEATVSWVVDIQTQQPCNYRI